MPTVADIAMCLQKECPLWMSCYRFRAVPSELQSYVLREPAELQEDGTYFCNDYWALPFATGRIRTIEEMREANRG